VPEGLQNVNRQGKGALLESMFATSYDDSIKAELPKCLRVMPHHQNTSGFFITIFLKAKEFDNVLVQEKESVEIVAK